MHEVCLSASHYPYIRDVGTTLTTPGWIHPNRITDYHVLIYCVTGQMQVVEDGIAYVLREGDLFFLKKGVHHYGEEGTLTGTTTFWIHFYDGMHDLPESKSDLPNALSASSSYPISPKDYELRIALPKSINLIAHPSIRKKLASIHESYRTSRPLRHVHLSMETMGLLLEVFGYSQQKQSQSKSDLLVLKLARFLEEHCEQPLDTNRIRETFQLNYEYLSTLFKTKLGTSIFKYHEQRRVQKAAELLKYTTLNVSEVSDRLQFKSAYYFSRVFKKVMGDSPSDYMKNIYRV
ncbi:helix-turn-helix transcriptional regulator [Cohnella herbarum]|uniref:AraC family transcriptional regulator n=1 Tax=Cohnella herbarum TaxID=2728023 RepID=A0A7Z2ZN06_9BACL|nr:helix-turn-helix domain-containing protein [Cohnella herbarum]QJD85579.1 AraC family transcriptional regulator [Cohnella herbarum]